MAVEGVKQKPVPPAIPKVPLLHSPEGGEAIFGIFVVAVLDGDDGFKNAVLGHSVGIAYHHWRNHVTPRLESEILWSERHCHISRVYSDSHLIKQVGATLQRFKSRMYFDRMPRGPPHR